MRTIRRRRHERKTDYKARFNLLKSKEKRLVARKSNKYLIVQIVETDIAQDKVIIGTTSKVLLTKGWPKEKAGSLKSIPAAYLTGFIMGKLAQEKKIKKLIFDIGMHRNIQKSRLYALLKGAIDSGLEIQHNAKIFPSDENLNKNELIKLKEKL
jgi:large subunit ribosomal protein L18